MDACGPIVDMLGRTPSTCSRIGVEIPLDNGIPELIRYLEAFRPVLDSFTHLDRLVLGYASSPDVSTTPPASFRDTVKKHLKEYDERKILEWQTVFDAESLFM